MIETISELQNAWSRIQTELSKNIEDRHFFDVYLSESYIHSIENGVMTVVVGSNLAVKILTSKYTTMIQDAAKAVMVEQKLDAIMDARGVFVGGVDITQSVIQRLKTAR